MSRRNARFRLLRDNVVIYTGEVESLKRIKDDVREVKEGFECGIKLKNSATSKRATSSSSSKSRKSPEPCKAGRFDSPRRRPRHEIGGVCRF